jgi:phosphotransacetylase
MGLSRPFNVVQDGSDMETVVNVIAITAAQAQAACGIDAAP